VHQRTKKAADLFAMNEATASRIDTSILSIMERLHADIREAARRSLPEHLAALYDWLEDGREFVLVVSSKGDARTLRKTLRKHPLFRRHAALSGKVRVLPSFLPPGEAYMVNLDALNPFKEYKFL